VHAYAWIKPPGESDGHYTGAPDFVGDVRCDPYSELPPIMTSSRPTNALPGAPPRGEWFPAAFTQLVRNAYPPI
jgi:cellulose 1,4-beta-cellobiosidase